MRKRYNYLFLKNQFSLKFFLNVCKLVFFVKFSSTASLSVDDVTYKSAHVECEMG